MSTAGPSRQRAGRGAAGKNNFRKSRVYKSVYDIFVNLNEAIKSLDPNLQQIFNDENRNDSWLKRCISLLLNEIILKDRVVLHKDNLQIGSKVGRKNLDNIASRFFVFNSPLSITAFKLHRNGMFSVANGMLIEFTSNLGSRSVSGKTTRRVFDISRNGLDSKLNTWKDWKNLQEDIFTRMRKKTIKYDQYYSYIFNRHGRGFLQTIIIHITGTLGYILNKFEYNKNSTDPKNPIQVLRDIYVSYDNANVTSIDFDIDMASMNYFREMIWSTVVNNVLQIAHHVYSIHMIQLPDTEKSRYGHGNFGGQHASDRLYFKREKAQAISIVDIITILFGTDDTVVNFWANLASMIFQMFLSNGYGRFSDVATPRFKTTYSNSIQKIYGYIYDMIMTTSRSNVTLIGESGTDGQAFLQSFTLGKDEWINQIMKSVEARPIRYLHEAEIKMILQNEQDNVERGVYDEVDEDVVDDEPELPQIDVTKQGNQRTEIESVPDFHNLLTRYLERESNSPHQNRFKPNEISVLVVEDPPANCLDVNGKCKSCGIDWKHLNGRIQILKCPHGVDSDRLRNLLQRTLNVARQRALHDHQQGNQQDKPDTSTHTDRTQQNEDNNNLNHIEITVPGSERMSTMSIQTRFNSNITRLPIRIVDGASQSTGQQHGGVEELPHTIPNPTQLLFNRVLSLVSEKIVNREHHVPSHPRLIGSSSEDITPGELSVSLVEEAGPTNENDDANGSGRQQRMRLEVSKRKIIPAIPDEDINQIVEETGFGNVNNSGVPGFSTVQSLKTQNQVNVSEARRDLISYPNIAATEEDNRPDNVTNKYTVEYLDTKDPTEYNIMIMISHWIIRSRFQVQGDIFQPDMWAERAIHCTSGPLSSFQNYDDSQVYKENSVPFYSSIWELLAVQNILSAYEMYHSIYDVIVTNCFWDSAPRYNMAMPYVGDDVQAPLTYMPVVIQEDRRRRSNFTLYGIVVVHIFHRSMNRQRRTPILTPLVRRIGLITNYQSTVISPHHVQNDLRILTIAEAQPTANEIETSRNVADWENANNRRADLSVDIINCGYAGPIMYYDEIVRNISTIPTHFINIMKNRRTIYNVYEEIKPFTIDLVLNRDQVEEYITQNCNDEYKLGFLRLLYGITPLNEASSSFKYSQIITTKNLPPLPTAAQLTAIVNGTNCFMENRNSEIEREIDSPVFSIIGPAGTGKTTTLIKIIECLLNEQEVSSDIIQTYEQIERFRNKDQPSALINNLIDSHPENKLRILILTETNVALDVLEDQLCKGIILRDGANGLRKVVPLYKRVLNRRDQDYSRSAMLHPDLSMHDVSTQQYEVPSEFRANCRLGRIGCIVLSTFGTIRRAVEEEYYLRYRNRMDLPQYDVAIIDEASQINIRRTLQLLVYNFKGHFKRRPTLIVAGDTCQNPPMSVGRNVKLKKVASVSILDVLTKSPRKTGKQFLSPWIMLNVQFRMHPLISELSNIVSNRQVFTHPDTLKGLPKHITGTGAIIIYDNFEPLRIGYQMIATDACSYPVTWIDPYKVFIPIRSSTKQKNMKRNTSYIEASTVASLIQHLFDTMRVYNSQQVLVLTPYNNQVDNIKNLFTQRDVARRRTSKFPGGSSTFHAMEDIQVCTIGSIQGHEQTCVIYSPVRRRKGYNRHNNGDDGNGEQDRIEGSLGIVGDLNTIYVGITRAKCQLFIVGDYSHLTKYEIWRDLDQFFSIHLNRTNTNQNE